MFSKWGKTRMSALAVAVLAIAAASLTYTFMANTRTSDQSSLEGGKYVSNHPMPLWLRSLWFPKKALGDQSFTNSVGMVMAKIPAGKFKMGSPEDSTQMPVHEVTFAKPFYMSNTVVTQAQWIAVMDTKPWIGEKLEKTISEPSRPATNFTLAQANEFCKKLSEKEGKEYRVANEAEWEYCAKAGSDGNWCFGGNEDLLEQYAWCSKNTRESGISAPLPVAGRKPNAFGLYDMHGNVWEICVDVWQKNYHGAPNDGSTWLQGGDDSDRVLRGGCYFSLPLRTTSAFRINSVPTRPFENVGLRIVCSCHE